MPEEGNETVEVRDRISYGDITIRRSRSSSTPGESETMNIKQSAWTGMLPVDDTALYLSDTGGPGRPVIYLNQRDDSSTDRFWLVARVRTPVSKSP